MIFIDYLYYKIYSFYDSNFSDYGGGNSDIKSIGILSALFGLNIFVVNNLFIKLLEIQYGEEFLFQGVRLNALPSIVVSLILMVIFFYRYLEIKRIEELKENFKCFESEKSFNNWAIAYFIGTFTFVIILVVIGV